MSTRLTLKFTLARLNRGKRDRLHRARETFTDLCNFYLDKAQEQGTTSRNTLHRSCYREACARTPLPARTVQQALDRACAALRAYQARPRGAPPSFQRPLPLTLRQDGWQLDRNPRGGWAVRFRVAAGEPPLVVPLPAAAYHLPYLHSLAGGEGRRGPLEVWEEPGGRVEIRLTVVLPGPESGPEAPPECRAAAGGAPKPPLPEPLGVDLGLRHLAVVGDPAGTVNQFFRGGAVRRRRTRWAERRAGLAAAGRRARVKREAGRERRWIRDLDHKLARRLVDLARTRGAGLVLEDLTGLRDSLLPTRELNRTCRSGWSYAQVRLFITHKAELAGVPVGVVDPRHTSRTCVRCGYCARENRHGGRFRCGVCRFELNADLSAARVIAARWIAPQVGADTHQD